MSRGIFVTGTDTGVGKTLVTAGIVRLLRKQGVDAVPVKPVQTGGEWQAGRLAAPDLEFCLTAAGIRASLDELSLMSPYVYEPACSPHLAGRAANRYPQIPVLQEAAGKLLQSHQALVLEGAGGVLAPLNETETMLDMMQALAYPVVLVARPGLGTINHTLLSIRALRSAGLDIIGVIFNYTEPERPEDRTVEEDNPAAIQKFGNVRILGRIRHMKNQGLQEAGVWERFEADMAEGWPKITAEMGVDKDGR